MTAWLRRLSRMLGVNARNATMFNRNDDTDQLFALIRRWKKSHEGMRFGQWIWNALQWHEHWEAPEANALFFVEDRALIEKLKEAYYDD